LRGNTAFVNGDEVMSIDLDIPDVPYQFLGLPQDEVERVLDEHLEHLGGHVERSTELARFEPTADGVASTLQTPGGKTAVVESRYLVGCDGAHSAVRKGLGLSFEGDRFAESYMLADVELSWSQPHGRTFRFT